jgi:hypothetical protein
MWDRGKHNLILFRDILQKHDSCVKLIFMYSVKYQYGY